MLNPSWTLWINTSCKGFNSLFYNRNEGRTCFFGLEPGYRVDMLNLDTGAVFSSSLCPVLKSDWFLKTTGSKNNGCF